MSKTAIKFKLAILKNTPFILFVCIFIIFGILSPKFFQYENFENIATSASYIGIVTVGMTFVLLTAGIDLSVGSNMFLSASIAGLLIRDLNAPIWLALLCAVLVGTLYGGINAFFIVKLRILPFLVTLSTLVAGRGLGLLITKSQGVTLPESISNWGAVRVVGLPVPIIIYAVIALIAHLFLKFFPMGRQIYAIGNDPEAAKKAGLNTDRSIAFVYIISGLLAAIAGIVSVSQMGIVNAGFGDGDEFDAIAAAVLGGTSLFGGIGTIFPGAVIGTILIQMVQAGLVYTQVDMYIQPLIQAAVIFVAVFLDSIRSREISKIEKRHIRVEN
ncbi:MAG: ABC transporter permease [Clostridia bacterium]|nr:ABC transporter permease [Clostridia bacterium]